MNYYLPPEKMCTLNFLKDVLNGKKLLKVSQIKGIPRLPRIPEINVCNIWNDIKHENNITIYFPD